MFKKIFYQSIITIFLFTLIFGLLYPLSLVLIGQYFNKYQSNGSLVLSPVGKVIGSELIGQHFTQPKYFWGRPSALDYDPLISGSSQYSPISNLLKTQVQHYKSKFKSDKTIPSELLLNSASGLDPEITALGAYFQIPRIASARNIEQKTLHKLVSEQIKKKNFGLLGQERVNVLLLNIKLDQLQP